MYVSHCTKWAGLVALVGGADVAMSATDTSVLGLSACSYATTYLCKEYKDFLLTHDRVRATSSCVHISVEGSKFFRGSNCEVPTIFEYAKGKNGRRGFFWWLLWCGWWWWRHKELCLCRAAERTRACQRARQCNKSTRGDIDVCKRAWFSVGVCARRLSRS
jgi:hypothetical protein